MGSVAPQRRVFEPGRHFAATGFGPGLPYGTAIEAMPDTCRRPGSTA
ncbi:hypothetical protein OG352_00540 [Streptomyces sp. NBC_01485]|nr:hypothetical protein [Streptomyces sp. NBC_01485]